MAKAVTSDYVSVNISLFQKNQHVLEAGSRWKVKGDNTDIEIETLTGPGLQCVMHFQKPVSVKHHFSFIQQPCNYGGFRLWFQCPRCQQKKGRLFLIGSLWLCRGCADLAYHSSQSRSHTDKVFAPLARSWAEERRQEAEWKKISQQKRKQYQYKGKLIKRLQTRSYNGAADTRLFDSWFQRVTRPN